jgi:hypothetical protein
MEARLMGEKGLLGRILKVSGDDLFLQYRERWE